MRAGLLCILFGLCLSAVGQNESKPIILGEFFEFHSDILDETRRINVYLPANYNEDSLNTYPVIYLLDGSMDEDFIHISGLVQFCSFSWINDMPECIVIGIANVDRKRDFTYPTTIEQDKKDFPTAGASSLFINFLEHELLPEVNQRYSIDTSSTLIGQSLGGLLATEILLKKPDLFDNYMIISPSLWWDNESLLKVEMNETRKAKRIYIAVGKEGEIMENDANDLFIKLAEMQNSSLEISFEFFEDKSHGDVLHQAIYNGFRKIF